MASLGTVPPDVLELIAYHAAVGSTVRPPTGLLSLLLLNRRTHALLEPAALPHLYASIFRATFDLPALHRRMPPSRLTSPRLALELRRRWTVLKRLRAHSATGTTGGPSHEETLWVALLLCLENDGRNLFLLRNYGQSTRWISAVAGRTFARHSPGTGGGPAAFLPARMHIEPRTIPRDTVEVALTIWLFWYLRGKGDLRAESQTDKERNRTMLRVFVFAAQIFDAHLQPWTLAHLPLLQPSSDPSSPSASPRSPELDQPFLADLSPRSATVKITYFGDEIALGKPNACWAGMMSFFARTNVWRATEAELDDDDDDGSSAGGDADDDDAETTADGGSAPSSPEASTSSIPGPGAGLHLAPELLAGSRDSLAFDIEWERLIACREPYAVIESEQAGVAADDDDDDRRAQALVKGPGSRGLGIWKIRGSFRGVWGGEFAFLDFDSYRDMLSGRDRVIYEGAFGIQPQIFRLTERLVLRPRGLAPPSSTDQTPALNAFFPVDFSFPFARAEPTGEEATGQAGYIAVSPAEEVRLRESGSTEEIERLEIVLSGTGHSAWGRFNLSGRVRLWDGLVYLLKDYAPESRGRWLYRGYVVGGGSMVGRWRDTFSPEIYSGYEGSFHMTRRG